MSLPSHPSSLLVPTHCIARHTVTADQTQDYGLPTVPVPNLPPFPTPTSFHSPKIASTQPRRDKTVLRRTRGSTTFLQSSHAHLSVVAHSHLEELLTTIRSTPTVQQDQLRMMTVMSTWIYPLTTFRDLTARHHHYRIRRIRVEAP